MNTKWDYAYHVKMVHQAGGPEAFMKRTRQSSFNAGYLIGRFTNRNLLDAAICGRYRISSV